MIAEASQQLGRKPDMILCSVGGGGLLGGVMTGCKAAEWEDGKHRASSCTHWVLTDAN